MNKDHVMVVANTLKKCILNGDIDLWMELLNIPDDISSQSLNKWFNDYFVVCRVQNCEIDICKPFHMRGIPFQGEFICSIKVEYAGYDDFGKDIVCASVSSIVITSINLCLRFNKESIKYKEEKDKLTIEILSNDDNITLTIENMLMMLEELASTYKKNIKIIKEEI